MKWQSEPFLAVLTIALTVVLILTRTASMSQAAHMTLLGLFVAGVFAYTGLIYRERPSDEREYELGLIASKHAYLVGSAVLSLGIVVQSLDHSLDVWLPAGLGSMVVVKTISYFVNNR